MEDNNVIRMDEHKKKDKVHKFSVKKILLAFVVCIILAVAVIAGTCKTKTIKLEGLSYYTEAEVRKAIAENGYINNSVAYYLKMQICSSKDSSVCRFDLCEYQCSGFNHDPRKREKESGCLQYNGKYVYFDKNGYALESYEKKYDDVPLVTGLKYNELQMQQKIDVKDKKVFSYLLELTTQIGKYHLPIDQIHIKEDGNALLISDDITVDLYNKNDIDIKIPELKGMLKKVKGKSGTIDMRYFSEDQQNCYFQPKNG